MVEIQKFYTIQQVAQILSKSPLTITRYCKSGKLTAFKIGREWRIPESGLKEFIEAGRVKGAADNGTE